MDSLREASRDAAEGLWIEGFSQVVCVYDDGHEAVVNACVESDSAQRLACSFTEHSKGTGRRAEARDLKLACLGRNLDLERQRRFGVNLRGFEAVS